MLDNQTLSTAPRTGGVDIELLRPYQREGVAFLAHSDSALLADEMGLGKTVEAATALRFLLRARDCDRALIVAPSPLVTNWYQELAKWAPELVIRRVEGSAEDRAALYRLPIEVLIASYEQVRADAQYINLNTHFDVIILDEAQRIKNTDSMTALSCRMLPRSRAWALTGTPIENEVDDLVSVFGFLKPGLLQASMSRTEIHARMQDHFLRRKKSDVLGDLPPMIVQEIPLELQGEQSQAYADLWESRKNLARADGVPVTSAQLLALITRLKQLCNFHQPSGESVKLEALNLILESFSAPTDKILIFSQYVKTLTWLSERIKIPSQLFHGELSDSARQQVLTRFDQEAGPLALLISLKAGGVGLNLNAASTVVLFDRWWNPAVEDQAVHRAHRFGREQPLLVLKFLVINSIEERIASILLHKKGLFDRYIEEADSAAVSQFDRNELRRLLDLTVPDVEQ